MFRSESIKQSAFSYYERLARVRRFVDEHYADDDLSLASVARVAGLEETYFSRYFHDKTGVCFRDWLRWKRVCRAVEIFKRRDSSITETGFAVGFGDLRTFERACQKCMGATPRAVKDRVRPC